ncbi:hypothetical protein G195_011459 [Phytophthora kernoviae 00238/432]|uniref:Uncharacterized protein n=1 Tax=Phytophthora kernoviae 00238/432 TaxID=1284355 RepID=A0A8J4RQD1_9STRA|nr:hypothetical protein G195_011459 [Phytophthora kernoviae 00238/432]
MQDTETDCSSIYIIEIPVNVIMADESLGKFRIVQVGRGKAGTQGLRKRMEQHNRAWHYATGKPSNIWNPNAQLTDYTVSGIPTIPVRDLLTQPFDARWGGRSVLEYGKHFSITDLRLVSETELTILKSWFADEWGKNRVARLSSFINLIARISRKTISSVRLGLSCEYKDTLPSSEEVPTRKSVETAYAPHLISCILDPNSTSGSQSGGGDQSTEDICSDVSRMSVNP